MKEMILLMLTILAWMVVVPSVIRFVASVWHWGTSNEAVYDTYYRPVIVRSYFTVAVCIAFLIAFRGAR